MKPLKATQQIVESNKWVRINYTTANEHANGYYIIKSDLYFNNVKKFDKVLKNCLVELIVNYKVTMKDIIISAIDKIKDRIQYYQRYLKYALDRPYRNDDDIQYFYDELVKNELILQRLEYKVCPFKNYTID